MSALLQGINTFFPTPIFSAEKKTCFFKHRFSSVSILISQINQVQTLKKYNYEYEF